MAVSLNAIKDQLNSIENAALKTEAGVQAYIANKTSNNVDRLAGQDANYYHCGGTCSWTCGSACSGAVQEPVPVRAGQVVRLAVLAVAPGLFG